MDDKNYWQGELLETEDLSQYSSWKAGGVAKRVYKPANLSDLSVFLKQLPADEPLLWLGLGSNTLIRDGGFNGTVIITQGCLKEMSVIDEQAFTLYAQAGVSCASMARFSARFNFGGAEFMAGIPGTVGGALRMNAGCFNGETWNYVTDVATIDRHGIIKHRTAKEFQIAYRKVEGLAADEWFVSGTFQLKTGKKAESLETIKQLLARRTATQPTSEHNCGSVFRNPPGDYAARLIETCGLKGFKLGGAVVSTKHANFIVNDGTAKACHIEELINHVATKVAQDTGIQLQREVHIVGDHHE